MLDFYCWLTDAPDIHRFPVLHMVETQLPVGNLSISEPSSGILENFPSNKAEITEIPVGYFVNGYAENDKIRFWLGWMDPGFGRGGAQPPRPKVADLAEWSCARQGSYVKCD